MTLDEAITKYRQNAEYFKSTTNVAYALELEQIAEWLEKLKYIENIILKWNADWYNDEDNGIPDNEILEAIFNACTDNGFDIPIDEDCINGKKDGYNKAIDDFAEKLNAKCDAMIKEKWNSNVAPTSWAEAYSDFKDDIDEIEEQLKEGGTE